MTTRNGSFLLVVFGACLVSLPPVQDARIGEVAWYQDMLGGEVVRSLDDLRGVPQIDVRVGGQTVVIRGVRPGEAPADPRPMEHFADYSSHNERGIDHFGLIYHGDLRAFCARLKAKGVTLSVEPWEFKPGVVLCYLAGPDGVSIEIIQADA